MRQIVQRQLKEVETGQRIGVGIENFTYHDRLFFYYGKVLDITDEYVILENNRRINKIELDDIIIVRKEVF